MKAKTFRLIVFPIAAVLLAILIAVSVAIGILADVIDRYIIGYKSGSEAGAAREAGDLLAEQIQGEGTVLVKNVQEDKDGHIKQEGGKDVPLLPLKKADTPKVNVFGWASTDWVLSGSGSGQIKRQGAELLLGENGALKTAGIEYNTALESMYESFKDHRYRSINGNHAGSATEGNPGGSGALHSFNYEFSRLYEPNIDDTNKYTTNLLEDAKEYSQTAIVVIGRVSGESNDSPKEQYKNAPDGTGKPAAQYIDKTRTYLEISTEEEELLKYVGQNYENVIVLINSTNVMELGFMNTIPGLDACLVVATTGTAGAYAIPRILYNDLGQVKVGTDENGEPVMKDFSAITPSGKLADTYAYDLSTSSTYVDVGSGNDTTHFYTNGKGLYPTNVQHTNGSSDEPYRGVAYQDYRESVYMGYKWYETADQMKFWESEFAKEHWKKPDGTPINGYNDVVQYPFGYGLSYTKFSWEVTHLSHPAGATLSASAITGDETITVGVTVTNTGSVAGQDVVELYYTAPYTENGIEKSHVNLLAFGKTTKILQPGDSQYVKLEFKISDMASYDTDNISGVAPNGGYVLEKGDYTLSLRTDSHTLAAGEKFVSNSDAVTAEINFHVGSNTRVMPEAENRFTGETTTDGVAIDGNSDGSAEITYLSRSDFAGTFPISFGENRAMTEKIKSLNLYTKAMADEWDATHDEGTVTFGENTGDYIVYENDAINEFGKKLGADYDDPEWDDLLNSIPRAQMISLVLHGFTKTEAVSAIGKPRTQDKDGPNQVGSFNADNLPKTTGYSSIVLAQTWNLELAYSMGLAFGTECIANRIQGWYGPGVNVHRSPFGGRNYEYYSEDAYMSGMMCAKVVEAAKNKGVFCYLKHICLYESESGRDGMYSWLTEQSLREVYVKPFEIAVKVGGSNAIMTSYGRIGAVWTGGSEALLTEVVRGEWEFQGAFITDYADHLDFMNGEQMVRAGGDIWMDHWDDSGSFKFNSNNNAFNMALRKAAKNVIYMWLNSLATNAEYNRMIESGEINDTVSVPTAPVLNFRWYIPVIVVADALLAAGAGVLIFFGIKKKDKVAADGEPETSEPVAEPVNNTAEETKAEPVTQTAAEPANTEGEAETPAPAKKSRAKKTPSEK